MASRLHVRPRVAVLLAMVLALFGSSTLGTGVWFAQHAQAAPPGAVVSTADLIVTVGGDRDLSTGQISPQAGVVVGIYGGGDSTAFRTCTTDATGSCTFAGLSAGSSGTKTYYLREESATAPLSAVKLATFGKGGTAPTPYQQKVTVHAGQTTTAPLLGSGQAFADDPGLVVARPNPPAPTTCGINIALMFDMSNSVVNNVPTMISAGDAFVDALQGTSTKIGIYHFSHHAYTDIVPTSVATSSGAQAVRDAIGGLVGNQGSTNWDAAFRQVAGSGVDMVLLLTDGNPTTYFNTAGVVSGDNSQTKLNSLSAGIASANAVKAQGIRIVPIGVDSGGGSVSTANLAAISGPSDYYLTDYSGLSDELKALATQQCGATVTVHKTLDGADASGWTFTPTSTTPGVTFDPTSATTDSSGLATFHVANLPAGGAQVEVSETAQSGVVFDHGSCSVQGATVTSGTATFGLSPRNQVRCEFANATVKPPVKNPIISGAKSADPVSGSTVKPGQDITYTVTVTNDGDGDATAVAVSDDVPAHTTLKSGSITAGGSSTGTASGSALTWSVDVPAHSSTAVSFTVTVDAGTPGGTTITNVAVVDNTTTPPVTHHVIDGSLTIDKSGPATADYGDDVPYTIKVTAVDAEQTGVVVTDPVPAGTTYVAGSAKCSDPGPCAVSFDAATSTITWQLGDLAAGASRTVTMSLNVTTPTPAADGSIPQGVVVNVATATSDQSPPVSDDATTVITAVPGATGSLTIDKSGPATADYGDDVPYTIKVTAVDAEQTGVVVTDPVPAGTTYVAGSAKCSDPGPCAVSFDAATSTITWKLGDLAAGASRTVTMSLNVTTPTPAADGSIPQGVVVNVATATSDQSPPVSDKAATVITAVLGKKFGPPPTDNNPPPGPGKLPFTGAPVIGTVALGAGMLLAGLALLVASLRRRESRV